VKHAPRFKQAFVTGNLIAPPFPATMEQALFGMGCFWGAERRFWQHQAYSVMRRPWRLYTQPTYEELCTGLTGHTEV
jgi:peptide-methionine (S)-S-oxide reductase